VSVARGLRAAVLALLAVELLDELVFGAREAAWPLVREDIGLSYAEVGLLLSVPAYAGIALEPVFGVLGDTRWRRTIVACGGIAFAVALGVAATASSFAVLLVAFVVLFSSSGAFVSLTQATLMDLEPERREHNMARWSVAGGIGAVAGPLALAAFVAVGLGWRELFAGFAVLTLVLLVGALRRTPALPHLHAQRPSIRAALAALRRREVVRWLVLLELCDLMLDVLLAFVALYFVDEVGQRASVGGIAVAIWTGAALVGGIGIVALLRRVPGLTYLRASALGAVALYAAFLLVPGAEAKLVLLALLGLATAGWYSIPKARLYASMPGQSGASIALSSLAGLIGATAPLVVALVAERYGLDVAMWILIAGPVALLVGTPRTGAPS
jgi:FSR family fosmidomycin resistance protein-like MFS transporter